MKIAIRSERTTFDNVLIKQNWARDRATYYARNGFPNATT